MNARTFVITGTDTGVGKTVFAAALTGAVAAAYWKPVQSGLEGETDSQVVARLGGVSGSRILPEAYRLTTPASPHLAAEIDGVGIDPDALTLPQVAGPLVIEGAGGLLVPLDRRTLTIDVFARWGLPVVLCARTALGAINHALLSLEALDARRVPVLGIAFVGGEVPDTQQTIAAFSGVKVLGRLPLLDRLTPDNLAGGVRGELSDGRLRRMTRSSVWHPFTQHAAEPPIPEVVRTEGAYLETRDGRRILDAISSWWVVTHGHRHPRIMEAIRSTAERLDQVIFAGFTHEPAERLARELVSLAPQGLDYVFYSDSGSTSVEVALKMALGTARNRGERRDRIVVMEHSYHGDTVGTMSVGARGVFNAPYEPLLFAVDAIPFPAAGREQETLDAFEAFAKGGRAAALIVEPLVLGAGGMLMYSPEVLRELKRIAEATGTLLITDEVMTGWGRTGTLFACEQAGIAPDILCTGKGLTGGSIPLAATLASAEVFDAHYSTDRSRMLFHSSSYTANPIACAAALANIEVWRTEPVLERIRALGRAQQRQLEELAADTRLAEVRAVGTIAAIELKVPARGYLAEVGPKLRAEFARRNLLLRPLGNVMYVMPPYCVTDAELDIIYEAISKTARSVPL